MKDEAITSFDLVNNQLANESYTLHNESLMEIKIKVTTYSPQGPLCTIQKEKQALYKMKPDLISDPTYSGKYVAVHDGKIIGVSNDWSSLAEKTYAKFGYIPILIEKIQPVPSKIRLGRPRVKQY